MNDKELLIMAARAAGVVGEYRSAYVEAYNRDVYGMAPRWVGISAFWNPITSDGDALRLAVKLDLHVVFHPALAQSIVRPYYCAERDGETIENLESNTDRYAATRRAIVRAAAEIGRKL